MSLADGPSRVDGRELRSTLMSAAAQVMLFFVLSRVTGVVRDVIILAEFDLSRQLDAYQAAFRLPDMLFEAVAGGALSSAFLPTFTRLLRQRGETRAWLLFSHTVNAVTLLLTFLAVCCIAAAPWLVRTVLAPGFDPAQQKLVVDLMRWLLLGTAVYGASGLCMAALHVRQHFLLPAFVPSLRNLIIIGAALFLAERWGVYALVAGAVTGAMAHLVVQLPALGRYGMRYRLAVSFRDPALRRVVGLLLPRMAGLTFLHLNFIVNTNLASQLGPGSVSALEYAFRLMLLPFGLFGQALAISVFPRLSAQVEDDDWQGVGATFAQAVRMTVFLALPAGAGMYLLRMPLVEVLYQRGSFTAESTAHVAHALQFYLIGLLAYSLVEITVRVFYACHDTVRPVSAGILIAVLNIGLSIWWVGPMGFGGLALANAVATSVEMILLLAWLGRRLPTLPWRPVLTGLGQAGLAAAGMAALLRFGLNLAQQEFGAPPPALLQVTAGVAVAVPVYFGLAWLLGFRDWTSLRLSINR